MSTKHNTLFFEMSIVKVRGEIAMWACAGPARSHEMHFDSILNNSNTLAR